jgi:hypothetical protein
MPTQEAHSINIVTSIIGYGVYFPALIVYEQLKALNYDVHIYIIERFFDEKAISEFERTKTAFQKDVRLVQIASRIPVKYTEKLSPEKTSALFDEWEQHNTSHFLCFSGLWLATLKAYKDKHSHCVIDTCRVDSAVAATWEALSGHEDLIANDLSFFNAKTNTVNYVLNIPEITPLPYSERTQNVTMHGGGWDLGDFTSKTAQFTDTYHVNLIVNDRKELSDENVTLYANQPKWNPLYANGFPPFGSIDTAHANYEKHPGILTVLAQSKAIVSKPGGMTLMDSLISETPLIFLKSVGKNENSNQQLWENLQLGISLETWLQSEEKEAILDEMQARIVALKTKTPCFLKTYTNLIASTTPYATKK